MILSIFCHFCNPPLYPKTSLLLNLEIYSEGAVIPSKQDTSTPQETIP